MQCSHAGRHTLTALPQTQTQRQVMHLCRTPNTVCPLYRTPKSVFFFLKHQNVYKHNSTHYLILVLLNNIHQPTWSQKNLSLEHDNACRYRLQRVETDVILPPPQWPCLRLNQSLRNRVFYLQFIWNWGDQPDVQSCLLKQSPCLGFGSWTDSQPRGMAAVEGLFKLHLGWWVAVRRPMDRAFLKKEERVAVEMSQILGKKRE